MPATCPPKLFYTGSTSSATLSWANKPKSSSTFGHTEEQKANDGFIFQSKSKSEQHLQHANVTSNKIFKCEICSLSFKSICNLNNHNSFEHERNSENGESNLGSSRFHVENVYENKCHKCESTFDYIKSLKNHMKIAHELND